MITGKDINKQLIIDEDSEGPMLIMNMCSILYSPDPSTSAST